MKKLVSRFLEARFVLLSIIAIVSSAFSPGLALSGEPGGAISLQNVTVPQGVKILAQVPLQGPWASHMFTQWEHGRTYLYVEQGGEQITAIDITKKSDLRVVAHPPEPVAPTHYEPADGGPIEVMTQNAVTAGINNGKNASTLAVLQADDPRDAQLLRLFGYDSSNLVDRDRRLVFFASPTRLLVLGDNRWYGVDYSVN